MKARTLLIGAATLAAVAGMVPAQAQGVSVCTFTSEVEITPGVSPMPTNGTFRTPEPGTIECTGSLEGTGTITYEGFTGLLGETCASDIEGTGTLAYTIGTQLVTGSFSFSRAGVAGGFDATTNLGPMLGAFQFEPAEGQDCATTPVTRATVTGQAVLVYEEVSG